MMNRYNAILQSEEEQKKREKAEKNKLKKVRQRAKRNPTQNIPGMNPVLNENRGQNSNDDDFEDNDMDIPNGVDPRLLTDLCNQIVFMTKQMDQLAVYIERLEGANVKLSMNIQHLMQQNLIQSKQIQDLYVGLQMMNKPNPSFGYKQQPHEQSFGGWDS